MEEVKNEKQIICDMCSVNPAIYQGMTHLEIVANMCENCFKFYGVKLGLENEKNSFEDVKPC